MIASTVHPPKFSGYISVQDRDSIESILVISSDIIYGEIVKNSYRESGTIPYYLPSFTVAIGTVSVLRPHAIILDLYQEDLVSAELFLRQIASLNTSASTYEPTILLSQSALTKIGYEVNGETLKLRNPLIHQQKDILLVELSRIEVLNHIRACLGWSD